MALCLVVLPFPGCNEGSLRTPMRWERASSLLVAPVHELVRDPEQPETIYAACAWQTVESAHRYGGVLRSDNGGRDWQPANQGLPTEAEVLSLVLVPTDRLAPGLVSNRNAEGTVAVLAGTRRSGLHVSIDQGWSWSKIPERDTPPYWDQLTLETLVVLPGEPWALALGTKEQGVLVSEDGGTSWRPRNEGLQNLSIQQLAVAPDGGLLAATWFGGLFRTEDRGGVWKTLSSEYERTSISTVAVSDDGTLWLGLQNGGLLAATYSGSNPLVLEPQATVAIGDGAVMALAPLGDRVAVGTGGRGAAFGQRDGPFVRVTEGLENWIVSTILLTGHEPDAVLVGTWNGIYRGVSPPSPLPGFLAAAAALALTGGLGWRAWRLSVSAAGRKLFRDFSKQPPDQLVAFWDRQLAELPEESAPAILQRMSHHMARSRDPRLSRLADFVVGTSQLYEAFNRVERRTDRDSRRVIAEALKTRVDTMEKLSDRLDPEGPDRELVPICLQVARQDTLYSHFLRAENLGHLTALRQSLEDVEVLELEPAMAQFFDRDSGRALGDLLEAIDQVARISSTEDQVLYIGQALSKTLTALDRRVAEGLQPSHRRRLGTYVLEGVRELLSTALRNIHQRARLRVTLHSKRLTTQREAVVVLELENIGQGHAQEIVVELQGSEGFRALRRRRGLKSLLRSQSARLEFLVEPLVSDRVRLRFSIRYDDLDRPGHRLEFADIVEFRKLGEHRAFRPLRPNPYVVGRPLLDSDIFMGREEIFEQLEASLRGAQQDNVVVLMGSRRMGKTSILRRLRDHLSTDYVPVLVDLQGMIGSGETTFFRELSAVLHDELEELGIDVPEPPVEAFESDPGGAFRRKFLKSARQVLGERRLLLLFDEFEVLEARIRSGDLKPRILPYFRSLMQHEKAISFLFAGTHRLDQLTRDYWGVLFNLAVYLEVGHLPRPEVERLFVEPTKDFFEIDPLALDKVFQLTGGHPHFCQLLARELVELRNQRKLAYLTIQDLNTVADRVTDKGQLHISYLWDDGSRAEQLFLLALKERLERTGMATLNAVQRSLEQRSLRIGDPTVALRQLVRREVLADNAGLLSFRIELLRLWLDRNHDLESFLLSEGSLGEV